MGYPVTNVYKENVLENRLRILDVLESLNTLSPHQSSYEEQVEHFGFSNSPQETYAHFDFLMNAGVAKFIVARSALHGNVVRISDLNATNLKREEKRVQRELKALRPRQARITGSLRRAFARTRWWFSSTFRTVVAICTAIVAIAGAVVVIGHAYTDLSHHKQKNHPSHVHAGRSSREP